MGNSQRVNCRGPVDSPTAPGFQSVMSDPLDEYCTADAFYDVLWSVLRMPFTHMETMVMKEHKVEDLGKEDCLVKVVYDGAKLKHFGLQKDDQDVCKVNQHIFGDRKEYMIVSECMDIDGNILVTGNVKLLADPLRVEYWWIQDGERKADKDMATHLANMYVNPILYILATRKVKVLAGHQSDLGGGGESVITEPMDEWVTFDMAWDFCLHVIKHPRTFPGLPAPQLSESEDGAWELTLPEHEGLKKAISAKEGTDRNRDVHYSGMVDKESNQIVIVNSLGDELLCTDFIAFHRNPVRIESWQEMDGHRLGGSMQASRLQDFIDRIIEKAMGKDGFYF